MGVAIYIQLNVNLFYFGNVQALRSYPANISFLLMGPTDIVVNFFLAPLSFKKFQGPGLYMFSCYRIIYNASNRSEA